MKINSNTIQYNAKKFVTGLEKGNALAPIILLEALVTGGRTYQAYKRDGFVEARERLTEESLGALFWLGGVEFFNKIGDFVGSKILKLKDMKFDVGKDNVRNPLTNYIQKHIKQFNNNPEAARKIIAKFKIAKVLSSVVLANIIIGFAVPKINQRITRKYQQSVNNLGMQHSELAKTAENMDSYIKKTNKTNENNSKKNVSFNGLANTQTLLSIAYSLENNPVAKLLSTDIGVTTGRAYNARNKDERIEVMFRDLSSIYFYMFCTQNLNSALNWIEDGRTTRLDAINTEKLHNYILENGKVDKNPSADAFKKAFLGNKTEEEIEKLVNKINFIESEATKNAKSPKAIKAAKESKIITLDNFIKQVGKKSNEAKIAQKMAELQPAVSMKNSSGKMEFTKILSKEQVKNIYRGGLINDPDFLQKIFTEETTQMPSKIIQTIQKLFNVEVKNPINTPNSINPNKFISEKSFSSLRQKMVDYIEDVAKKADGKEITKELLEKMKKQNFAKNALNLGVGFAVSGYFLSTAIPKIQYWITKKRTGKNQFPGTAK